LEKTVVEAVEEQDGAIAISVRPVLSHHIDPRGRPSARTATRKTPAMVFAAERF
jgi:hypothetical protein